MFENPVNQPITAAVLAVRARSRRDEILRTTVDRVNPVRYNALTLEQQQELAVYRQALLDITQQPDFPFAIQWPRNPSWLR